MKDFLTGVQVTLYSKMLTFRATNESFKLDGDLLKTMINYKFNVSLSNRQDRKLIYESGEEMKFKNKRVGRKSTKVLKKDLL